MNVPDLLRPTATHRIALPSGVSVEVPKATPSFQKWNGEPPGDTYGGKQLLNFDDRPAFAELVILWSFLREGWQGVWIDTYRKAYRTGYWGVAPVAQLPDQQAEVLARIAATKGSASGAWDVFCWTGEQVVFAESKKRSSDAIRPSQERWLEAALGTGLPLTSFLVVEWSLV